MEPARRRDSNPPRGPPERAPARRSQHHSPRRARVSEVGSPPGVHPRTWVEKEKAQRAMVIYVAGWLVTLAILLLIIYTRGSLSM